jgi:ubiquinone/menaquinone biosynthesis C-methylase UbiE
MQERERQVLRMLDRHGFMPLSGKKILEIGCGTGKWLRDFIAWGAQPENLYGVDLLPTSVARGRKLCPEQLTIECRSAADLGYEAETYDLVVQATVFTSVLDPDLKQQIASEMLRVVRGDGLILWYDFYINNPRNPDVRAVGKQEIRQLFPNCSVELRRITLAPPLARRLAPWSWLVCYLLARVPLLCTHYLGAIRKRKHGHETHG